MIDRPQAAVRPILVVASEASDAGLARSAVEELGRLPVLVQDVVEAMRQVGGDGKRYGAMVVGDRVDEVSGFTLCAVARDAGCRLPMILMTSDVCRWTAVRAAMLQVTVLWHPVPARRIAQTLRAMLPSANICLAVPPAMIGANLGTRDRERDRWRPSRSLW